MAGLMALAVFVFFNTAVGLRLLRTAARGGGAAAWTCGFGFTLIGLLGHPLHMISGAGSVPVGEVHQALGAAGSVFIAAGLSAFFAFTLIAFRRTQTWAWIFTGTGVALLFVSAFGQIGALATAPPEMPSAEATRNWSMSLGILSTICYAWSGIEGIAEWTRARRRVALGLTDPLTANRILLWGVHGVCVTMLNGMLMTLSAQGVNLGESLLAQIGTACFSLVSCATITLAFFPTRAWASWVRRNPALVEA